MKIVSSAFKDGEMIPRIYTCEGKNINPPLEFQDIPVEAITLALIMDDPDAREGTFDHWLIWNLKSTETKIEEGQLPYADYGMNGFGFRAYGGPCPPQGEEHHYFFRLYALKKYLTFDLETSAAELRREVENYSIDKALLMGRYKKEN